MEVRFPSGNRSHWKDNQLEVVHEVMWHPEKQSIISAITLTNLTDRAVYVPHPLVMPLASGSDKNNLRLVDDQNRELPMKGLHSIFMTDPDGREIRPYLRIAPGAKMTSSFELKNHFEGIDTTKRIRVYLDYTSVRKQTYIVDETRNITKTECWYGEAKINPIEFELIK
jgi:hypothetical protein